MPVVPSVPAPLCGSVILWGLGASEVSGEREGELLYHIGLFCILATFLHCVCSVSFFVFKCKLKRL